MSKFHIMPTKTADAMKRLTNEMVVFIGVAVALYCVEKLYVLFLLMLGGWLWNLSGYLVWHCVMAWKLRRCGIEVDTDDD